MRIRCVTVEDYELEPLPGYDAGEVLAMLSLQEVWVMGGVVYASPGDGREVEVARITPRSYSRSWVEVEGPG